MENGIFTAWMVNVYTLDIQSYLLRFGVLDIFFFLGGGVQIPRDSKCR